MAKRTLAVLILVTGYCLLVTGAGLVVSPGLPMLPAENDQIAGDEHQSPGSGCQVNVCLHASVPPFNGKVNNKQKYAADNGRQKNCVSDVPFDHNFTPSIIFNEETMDAAVMRRAVASENRRSEMFKGRIKSGEITPTANQATAILPTISDSLSNWLGKSFNISG